MLTFGSLFAGIGGFDLGFEQAGMTCLWQVEINPFCQRVLAKHWPHVRRLRDARQCGRHNLEPVDLICGGFPCLSTSIAGKRGGIYDDRWLWPEFSRIIGELKPRWVVVENVPGLLSVNSGRAMGEILRDLAGCGYDAEWESLPAYYFGSPQSRIRIFLVAYPKQYTKGEGPLLRWWSWHQMQIGSHGWDRDAEGNVFAPESNVERVAYGIPDQLDRNRVLGNAVIPTKAEFVGRLIMEIENAK